jgi:citrate lyase subunit beta/citryl-CoA lyase
VDHYAGTAEKIDKALILQEEMSKSTGLEGGGALFDVTCDCEDGAGIGAEEAQVKMCVARVLSEKNHFGRVGARIHDAEHPCWQMEMEILVREAGERLAFLTLPKARSAEAAARQIEALRGFEARYHVARPIPAHVLIETQGALRDVWKIAALVGVESLDFGLMDFVSDYHGAIPGNAMQSPGQFRHPLVVRAKCEVSAAAHAYGRVPAHNVSAELRDGSIIAEDARRARREFGFLRMWSVHPRQIRPILEAMRPDVSEIQAASEILLAAQAADWEPTRYRDCLHDRASYRYYWNLLLRARQAGAALPEEAVARLWGKC